METLRVEVADASLLSLYMPTQESAINRSDSGFDLYMAADAVLTERDPPSRPPGEGRTALGAQGPHGYYLFPRSSISKTPLRLANSVGIIDFGYRGTLKVAVHNTGPVAYTIRRGDRLFQLCMPSLAPFQVVFGAVSRATERGEGGFGSTTKEGVTTREGVTEGSITALA